MTDGHLNKCIICCRLESKENFKKADKNKINAQKRESHRRNPDKSFKWHLKHSYGITIEQYDAMLVKQNDLCSICKKPGILVVDHNHKTNKFRGLLHRNCNSALGLLQDDPMIVLEAASYLAMDGT